MRRTVASLVIGGAIGVGWGCGKRGGDDARQIATTVVAAAATTAPVTTATASSGAVRPKLGPGRSAVPTLDEWSSQMREVTVKGSSALRCETKIVREYLRIACKGKVDPEGTPTGIKILKGGGEALTFAHGGVTSLIFPFVDGTDFEGVFSWTNKSHKLVVAWPKGAKQPVIVGTFEGAASPLDGAAKGDDAKLCACHMKVTHATTCEDVHGGADADCDRTYGDDCPKLLACASGDWRTRPRCLPGFVNGTFGHCGKLCNVSLPCPGEAACLYMFEDAEVGVCGGS
jgi:hypothetical protein